VCYLAPISLLYKVTSLSKPFPQSKYAFWDIYHLVSSII
jgi:hypothetical protein